MTEGGDKIKEFIAQIWALLEPVIASEGFEVLEIEYRREAPGWVLRIYIDQEDGVAVDDCARISHVVGDVLDVAEVVNVPYHLEISSPGLDRPLRKVEHFRKHIGSIVKVRSAAPIEGRKKFKGRLTDAGAESITLDCDGQECIIPLSFLERAQLCYFESTGS